MNIKYEEELIRMINEHESGRIDLMDEKRNAYVIGWDCGTCETSIILAQINKGDIYVLAEAQEENIEKAIDKIKRQAEETAGKHISDMIMPYAFYLNKPEKVKRITSKEILQKNFESKYGRGKTDIMKIEVKDINKSYLKGPCVCTKLKENQKKYLKGTTCFMCGRKH